jgi:hypothetical protein
MSETLLVASIMVTILNLGILALNLKLYTEWWKARGIQASKKGGGAALTPDNADGA